MELTHKYVHWEDKEMNTAVWIVTVSLLVVVADIYLIRKYLEKYLDMFKLPSFYGELDRIREDGGVCYIKTTTDERKIRVGIVRVGRDFVEVQGRESDINELIPFSMITSVGTFRP